MARMDVKIEVEHDGTLEAARELGAIRVDARLLLVGDMLLSG